MSEPGAPGGTEGSREPGSRGVALAVALAGLGFFLVLPVLTVVGIYTMLSIYAIVKAVGSAPDEPNATAIVLGIVGLTTLFVLLLGAAISVIGRMADPERRR